MVTYDVYDSCLGIRRPKYINLGVEVNYLFWVYWPRKFNLRLWTTFVEPRSSPFLTRTRCTPLFTIILTMNHLSSRFTITDSRVYFLRRGIWCHYYKRQRLRNRTLSQFYSFYTCLEPSTEQHWAKHTQRTRRGKRVNE